MEWIQPGPDAEKEAEKARIRLINQVDERRHPRTKATLAHLIEKHLDSASLDPGRYAGTNGTSKTASSR
jgi:hypothetical protein